MNFQDRVSIDLADNGVAQVRFTRGDKMNALDGAQFEAVLEAGQALREMKGLRVAVLSGEGRAFCAGLDLSSMAAGGSNPQARLVDRKHGNANRAQEAAMTWRKCPVPVIAAVHGVCFGGGLQIQRAIGESRPGVGLGFREPFTLTGFREQPNHVAAASCTGRGSATALHGFEYLRKPMCQ